MPSILTKVTKSLVSLIFLANQSIVAQNLTLQWDQYKLKLPQGTITFKIDSAEFILKKNNTSNFNEKKKLDHILSKVKKSDNGILKIIKGLEIHKVDTNKLFEFKSLFKEMSKNDAIDFASPILTYSDNKKIGLSDIFHVQLRSKADYNILKTYSEQFKFSFSTTQFKDVFSCKISKQSPGNTFEISKYFQEKEVFKFSEPDFLVFGNSESLDPFFQYQWGLKNTGQFSGTSGADIQIEDAWEITNGSASVKIAILDCWGSSEQFNHEDISIPEEQRFDFTGNGFSSTSYSGDAHGIACAGIIAAKKNNNLGIAGIASGCKIQAVKIGTIINEKGHWSNGFWSFVTTNSIVANAIDWARLNSDIVSNSNSLVSSSLIDLAISRCVSEGRGGKGTPFFSSSGNNSSSDISYPASNTNTIAVGATDYNDFRADFSNFSTGLDIAAPGVKISTLDISGDKGNLDGDYNGDFTGTSAACPYAAGTMALLLSINQSLTNTAAREILETTCEKVGAYGYNQTSSQANGTWSQELGYGRINAYRAVLKASTPDLTIIGQEALSAPIPAGGLLTVYFAEDNNGYVNANPNHVKLYLSKDAVLTPDLNGDVYLGQYHVNQTVSALSQTILLSQQITIPANITAGTYRLYFFADANKVISESNEDNNFASVEITVTGGASVPDLTIQSPQVSPPTIAPSGTATISYTVKNQGTASASESTTAIWLSKDQEFKANEDINLNADMPVPALAKDASSGILSRQITISAGTPPGKWYIMLGADALEVVNEGTDEDNNQYFYEITVGSSPPVCISPTINSTTPDRTVTLPTGTSFGVNAGGSHNAYKWEFNNGSSWQDVPASSPYSGTLSAVLTIANTTLAMNNYQYRCEVGSTCTTTVVTSNPATLTVQTAAGSCDNDNPCQSRQLAISNASIQSCNYTSCTTVGATGGSIDFTGCVGVPYNADRYDDDVWFSFTPANNNPVTMKIIPTSNVNNLDLAMGLYSNNCGAPLQLDCHGDNNPVSNAEEFTFIPSTGTTYLIRVFSYGKGAFYSGNFDICVRQDGNTEPPDPDEAADLDLDNLTLSTNTPCAGNNFSVSYKIENNGNVDASQFTVNYYLSSNDTYSSNDVLLSTRNVTGLDAGDDITHNRTVTLPPGTSNGQYYVIVIVDQENAVAEGEDGKDNNVGMEEINVSTCSLADIIINYSGTPPTTGIVDERIELSYQLKNIGGVTAPRAYVRFYISYDDKFDADIDTYVDDSQFNSLDAEETDDETISLEIPECQLCGSYYIIMVVDYENTIPESNKNNNFYVFPVEITGCVPCSITVPPTGIVFKSGGGTGNIAIMTNSRCCKWTATTSDSWITIKNNTGVGEGIINYSVAPYEGDRVGIIYVDGQPHQITQTYGDPCTNYQVFQWAAQAGSTTLSDAAADVATDASGNIYITGDIQGSADFGHGFVLTTPSVRQDIFVAKYNNEGNLSWAVKFGDIESESGDALATDSDGNIYVIGQITDYTTFGNTTITNNGENNDVVFLLKLSPTGSVIWVIKVNTENSAYSRDIAIDGANNIYVYGDYRNNSTGEDALFLAKYTSSGIEQSFIVYGTDFNSKYGEGLTVDNFGDIYVSGRYRTQLTLGSTILTATTPFSDMDGFIAKINNNGTVLWSQKLTSPGDGNDNIKSITTDQLGNVYAIGEVDSTAIVGNITIPLSNSSKSIIIKYNPSGIPIWAKALISGFQGNSQNIILNKNGDLCFSGSFADSLKIDSVFVTSNGSNDAYVACMDTSGNIKWIKGFGGPENDLVNGITINANNEIFVAGDFENTMSMGNTTITSSGNSDIYLAKFAECIPPLIEVISDGNYNIHDMLNICPGQRINFQCFVEPECPATFKWYLGDSLVGTNREYTATEGGSYTVYASFGNGCTSRVQSDVMQNGFDYTFIGSGNWSDGNNWKDGLVPPSEIDGCSSITVNPAGDSECILNVNQKIGPGASLVIVFGKKFRIIGDFGITQEIQ